MIRKKPAPDAIRAGNRFSEKIMRREAITKKPAELSRRVAAVYDDGLHFAGSAAAKRARLVYSFDVKQATPCSRIGNSITTKR